MKGIYKFEYYSRMGDICGIFTADSKEVKESIGYEIMISVSKWTDLEFEIEKGMFTLISEDPDVIDIFEKLKMRTGVNIIQEYQNQKEWEEDRENYEDEE